MSTVGESEILDALSKVIDPDLKRDIVSLGFVQDLQIEGEKISFRLVLTTPACPMKDVMKAEAEKHLMAIDGIGKVEITLDSETRSSREPEDVLPNVKHVLLVGSGKGGVGKSTVAVNLAAALMKLGAKVGIMDADIYGPSIPPMLGVKAQPKIEQDKMVPPVAHGMPVMSIGFMVGDAQPLVWRGPILHQVITQFVNDVNWGELDYLVVDLPPGTGDVQLSLSQLVHASGALMVTTPQDIAFRDVRRAAMMFNKVDIPIIGLVENMGSFVCPHCGEVTEIFPVKDNGAVREIAGGLAVETLVRLPIEPAIARSSESGTPIVIEQPDSKSAECFLDLAGKIAQRLSILAEKRPVSAPAVSAPAVSEPVSGGATDQD